MKPPLGKKPAKKTKKTLSKKKPAKQNMAMAKALIMGSC